jgi:catechol 2,3-dioxygenase-like lactoylglutathione lyase family enzyme
MNSPICAAHLSGTKITVVSHQPGVAAMPCKAIDHINILTLDVDKAANFYEQALGLQRGESAGAKLGYKGCWMFDPTGHPLVHVGFKDPERDYGPEHVPGAVTGSFHHVAFACEDFAGSKARLDDAGIEYRAMDHAEFGLCQITLKDPNNINVEMNFASS